MSSASVTRVCKKCNTNILEAHAYELGDDRWHTHCFKCLECDSLLGCNSNFLVLGDGNLICSNCTYDCKQCGKKIDDLAILTGDQAYCSNCFKCRACKLKIEDLRYARTLKGLFCMSCHEKLVAKKKKYDLKRRQMAQLGLLLRPALDQDANQSSMASVPLLPSELYLETNTSLTSLLNKQTLPQPPAHSTVGTSTEVPISIPDSLTPGITTTPPAASTMSPLSAEGENPPFISPAQALLPGSFPKSTQSSLKSALLHPAGETHSNLSESNFSSVSAAADIEEVNDSDDELNLRRMRERLQRRFERLAKATSKDDGAILDLIDSFSGPNTPNTIYTAADQVSSSPLISLKERDIAKQATPRLQDNESDAKFNGNSLDPGSPHKNFLLLSPNQFQDHEFHNAKSSDLQSVALSMEELNKPRSVASSPMAKANRQARVVETNDEIQTAEISSDNLTGSFNETPLLGQREDVPSPAQVRDGNSAQDGLYFPQSTPKKSPASLGHAMSSPPPRLALPEIPSTPQQRSFNDAFEPRGLGLEGVELQRATRNGPVTPAVTNLEDTIEEDDRAEDTDIQQTPKQSVRRKMLLRHKRSTSGGLSFGGKFPFFKNKDDESKGHARHALDGSIQQGVAYATPPLPLSSPLRQGSFKDGHARSTSDTQFFTRTDSEVYKSDLELRSLKVEVHQLENRRQSLLSENMKLSSDKNRIQESVKELQRQLQTTAKVHEDLLHKMEELTRQNSALSEENGRLVEQNNQLKKQAIDLNLERSATTKMDRDLHLRSDSWNDTIETEVVDETSDTQKATRLKFWRRPKATMSPHLVSTNGTSVSQLLAALGGSYNNGSSGSVNSGQGYKLSQSYSSNAIQIPHQNNNGEDSTARKTLNSFISKSRSTTLLDPFSSGASNGVEVPLFSSTLQRRAIYEHEKVPLIITKCLKEVEDRGLDMEGIYRISGGSSAITAIENAFGSLSSNPSQDKKQMAKLNDSLSGDINAVTSALKRYLRKLPDPLIPYALYDNFIKVGKNSGASAEDRCNELLNKVLLRLPPANRHALFLLGKHLEVVNLYSSVNRMNYKNLSVVFAPTIARDATGEREMTDMAPRNEATELLFSHFQVMLAGYEP